MKYKFKVMGRTNFPIDMLRHDRACPYSVTDSMWIDCDAHGDHLRPEHRRAPHTEITLLSELLTPARWSSYGWPVIAGSVEELS